MASARPKIATISICGCFGCHMSLLDLDERLFQLIELVDIDRSPINDIKRFSGRCAVGLLEGSCANEDDVAHLREFREHCDLLISVGECAINGDVPALRNGIPLRECLEESFINGPALANPGRVIPNDPELPLLLDRIYPCHEVVQIDHFIPGCPAPPEAIWQTLTALLQGKAPELPYPTLKYD